MEGVCRRAEGRRASLAQLGGGTVGSEGEWQRELRSMCRLEVSPGAGQTEFADGLDVGSQGQQGAH